MSFSKRSLSFKKPKTRRGKRALENKAPKLIENEKKIMFVRGHKTNSVVNDCLVDLRALTKPRCFALNRQNDIRPFEDIQSLEFLSDKNDSSLFVLGNHTKKRPNNLVFGRMFDNHLLDMVEVYVKEYKSMSELKGAHKVAIGSKPLLMFVGAEWEHDVDLGRFRDILIDVLSGHSPYGAANNIDLTGIDRAILIAAEPDGHILFRHYHVRFLRSGTRVPKVSLDNEIGPTMRMQLRRVHAAPAEVDNVARKVPKFFAPKKEKNVKFNEFREKHGQVHMHRQDISGMALARSRALGKKRKRGDDSTDSKRIRK